MAEKGDSEVLRLVVAFLRGKARMSQMEFGRAARIDQSEISDYERGVKAPPEDHLRRMAQVADMPWHLVVHHARFVASVLAAAAKASAGNSRAERAILDTALLAMMPYVLGEEEELTASDTDLLQEAEEIWSTLEGLPMEERRQRIRIAPPEACWSWAALTRVVCETSERSAADSATAAQEMAEFAFLVAERVTGEEAAQAIGYAWGYLANARRVALDFDSADEAFNRAWSSRRAGVAANSELLPDWRLLDLEASLRREQHRFEDALDRLDQARACSGGDRLVTARLLLKKSNVFHQMGKAERALTVLEEAAPLIEGTGDPRQLLALHFNMADNLCRLERYEEAAQLLPQVHEWLAAEQNNRLDRIRTEWLKAKVKAGLGQREEAMAALEAVRDAFTAEDLAYDAAQACLDLALLWLEAGRLPEVRELSLTMGWIFQSKKIHREALASLTLFCEAAKQEAATVALTRQVIADVEEARRSAPPLRD